MHTMVPVYMPLLLPLTMIAIPVADLVLAVVRRTWNGQSPFAADRGHLHHRLLEIGHSHSRAVLIMYFWSALFAFAAVAFSVRSSSLWIVLVIVRSARSAWWFCCCRASRHGRPRWAQAVRSAAVPASARCAAGAHGGRGSGGALRTARPSGEDGRGCRRKVRTTAERRARSGRPERCHRHRRPRVVTRPKEINTRR